MVPDFMSSRFKLKRSPQRRRVAEWQSSGVVEAAGVAEVAEKWIDPS
jgi:hypothetical protein